MRVNVSPNRLPCTITPQHASLNRTPHSPPLGVYHCTEPVPAEPDWGIALRVSQEDDEGGIVDGGSGDANPHDAATSKRKRKSGQVDATTSRSSEERRESVLTPPLLVPLRSGDAYFLLDDFK